MTEDQPSAPQACPEPVETKSTEGQRTRTFSMNSREFYEAVCAPRERPWISNGSLPPEPRAWKREVIVERRGQTRR